MADVDLPTDDAIREELLRKAVQGYETDDEIVASVVEVLVDEHGDEAGLPSRVTRLAPEVFAAQAALERAWPVPTDCDRLDRTFASLEQHGVVARQHFTCCQNCGHAEIGDEIEAAGAKGPVRGYVFFHQQDTEAVAEGGPLYLAYGAVLPKGTPDEDWKRAAVEVGREIVASLRAEGLEADWNGDLGKRIHVGLTWRRRRRRA